jgi:hypothetical protein
VRFSLYIINLAGRISEDALCRMGAILSVNELKKTGTQSARDLSAARTTRTVRIIKNTDVTTNGND